MYHLVRCLFSGAPEKVEKVSGDNEGGRKEGPSAVEQDGPTTEPRHLTLMTLFCISISILRYLTLALMANNKRNTPLKDNDIFAFIFRKCLCISISILLYTYRTQASDHIDQTLKKNRILWQFFPGRQKHPVWESPYYQIKFDFASFRTLGAFLVSFLV